jgi:hypothetical protein
MHGRRTTRLTRVRRLAATLLSVVAVAAVGWFVAKALDKGSEAIGSNAPVYLHAETDLEEIYKGQPDWQSYGAVIPESLAEIGPPPGQSCRTWRKWALDQGGVDADESRAVVYIQGKERASVLLRGIEIKTIERKPPLRGTHVRCSPAGGAVASPRRAEIYLDTNPPTVAWAKAGDDSATRSQLQLSIAPGETEIIDLIARLRRCDWTWTASLFMIVNGESYEAKLNSNFQTTASWRAKPLEGFGGGWRPWPERNEWYPRP